MFISNERNKIMNNLENLRTAERQLLQLAIEALHHQTGLRLHIHAEEVAMGDRMIDAILEVEGYEALRFVAEIKKWVQQANIGALLEQVRQLPGKGLLVADYVNADMAERFREMNIPFIDTVGNAYINEKPLYVFIKGNRQQKITGAIKRGGAFNPAGIKVVHALLLDQVPVNATYREIAQVAGVALGAIGGIYNDLKAAGFMVELQNKKRQLQNKRKLLDRWVEAYLEKLKPKQLIGRFTVEDEFWWKTFDLTKYDAKWGGEVAAAKATEYLQPEKVTIYLFEKGGDALFRDARFRKDNAGEITVYRAFWKQKAIKYYWGKQNDMVDPLIIYADLIATADPRNMETAKILYGEELARLVEEY